MSRLVLMAVVAILLPVAVARASMSFDAESMAALPVSQEGAFAGAHGDTLMVGGDAGVYVMPAGEKAWRDAGRLHTPHGRGVAASTSEGVVRIGDSCALLQWTSGSLRQRALPDLPVAATQITATAIGAKVYVVAGDTGRTFSLDVADAGAAWQELTVCPRQELSQPALVALQSTLLLFARGEAGPVAYRYDTAPNGRLAAWRPIAPPLQWPDTGTAAPAAVAYGHSHVFVFGASDILAYHSITDTWINVAPLADPLAIPPLVVARGEQSILISGTQVLAVNPRPVETNYGWIDHSVVGLYLLSMIGMGWYFARRENSTKDYFRGGQRVPWWASGMSLFATGASAISLMAMPGMAYSNNWTYFTISICAIIALPIAMFVMAPLVRRLNIATANEYLERRFGLAARLLASVIYCFSQVAARMASVMLLPAIALAAITGVEVVYCIIIMGVITTIYTYLGGLEAVIWTDTVQGFIMVGTVLGCLILALVKLGMPVGEMWAALQGDDKLHMIDLSLSIMYPTAWIFLISGLLGTAGGISDQNFVQRVQCTPDLRQTRLAVATQIAVAVPINLLLFSLGTALWLFYRDHPAALNPVMKTDGIFPFFVAQQLPVGVSGLVVAALLAATMSTISSSICSVSDLGVNDFYRRFNRRATDHSSLLLGRGLTAVVGVLGTSAALLMARSTMVSVWDLATLVTGLISNGILGLYLLGLLTRRAHQGGALIGVGLGMLAVFLLRTYTPVTFWLYGFIGSAVTFVSGYALSLVLPGRARQIEGLTIYTLSEARPAATAATATDAPAIGPATA